MEDATAKWCELNALPGSGYGAATPVAGGILVFHLEYAMLDWAATPATGCVMPSKAPVTVPGVVLQDWYAWAHEMVAGVGIVHNSAGDTSDGPSTPYMLGPAAVPSGPYTVQFTVNGLGAGTATTTGPPPVDAWSVKIDLKSFPAARCTYALVADYGGASAMKVYQAADCDPNAVQADDRPPATRAGEPNGSRPPEARWAEGKDESDDQDLDGASDDRDACPHMAGDEGEEAACDPDLDGDGVLNGDDNCPQTPNPAQADKDEDGVGDACASDADGDGIADPWDNCPEDWNELQVDLDGDGEGNVCDDDDDGDGVPDKRDDYPDRYDAWRDLDGDGVPDNEDADLDGDGFLNADELRAGTDPEDADSAPLPDELAVHRVDPAETAGVGLFGSLGLVALLAGVGVVLFLVIRPREDGP